MPQPPEIKRTEVGTADSINDDFIAIGDIPSGRIKDPLKAIKIKPLPAQCLSKRGCTFLDLDNMWMVSQVLQLNKSVATVPGWAGFMKSSFSPSLRVPDEVMILPFALGKPSDEKTIFSCLKYARAHSKSDSFFVTFDQPLYSKAIDILFSFPHFL